MNLLILKTKIRRALNRTFGFEHFSSAPYLSGDTFRSICNHAFDEFSDIIPTDVQRGDIIFVKNNFLKEFFTKVHPKINQPYILLNHNDDTTIDEPYMHFIDEKIIHWFGLNINVKHPKMTPLPIGIENIGYRNKGILKYFLKPSQNSTQNSEFKLNKILVAFHTNNVHPERIEAFIQAKKCELADIQSITPKHDNYIQKVSTYNFILSPRGAGIDCHRTWESIYLGTIPIVLKSPNTSFFVSLGLPLLVLDSWKDLATLDQVRLQTYLESFSKTHSERHPAMYIEYWLNLIQDKRTIV